MPDQMSSDIVIVSIADQVKKSLAVFEAIEGLQLQEETSGERSSTVSKAGDLLVKFKLWAGNIGAHRVGRSSLDYRLRDSTNLRTQVFRLLDDLITSLNEVLSILSGERVPWDREMDETGDLDEALQDLILMDQDFEFESELSQLTKEIDDTIGNLLRLSMSLRNPAPHDHFMSTEYANVRYFVPTDIAHVEAKFPSAPRALIERLGRGLSQRRQYFRYRQAHHEKLINGLRDKMRSDVSTIASSIPLRMKDAGACPKLGEIDEDEQSDTAFSQTSIATTAPDSAERLRIPPLPKESQDGPFECPFCFLLISVSSVYRWKKHVLSDLRPYSCLAENCPIPSRTYGRRHHWISHMIQVHWKSWVCPYECKLGNATETELRRHIFQNHGHSTSMEIDSIISRSGRNQTPSSSNLVSCPLCQHTSLESVRQYQTHVGRHQIDLALFTLPKAEVYGDEDDEPGEEGVNESADNDSERGELSEEGVHISASGDSESSKIDSIRLIEDSESRRRQGKMVVDDPSDDSGDDFGDSSDDKFRYALRQRLRRVKHMMSLRENGSGKRTSEDLAQEEVNQATPVGLYDKKRFCIPIGTIHEHIEPSSHSEPECSEGIENRFHPQVLLISQRRRIQV
ncbi:hypothetical protein F5Y16DRAFT_68658 [Xylariaceae sp. FL0255]|nr:hypothetical protein F5Y16DRAFT_68658 [Xylariaceae sp. FL0255]